MRKHLAVLLLCVSTGACDCGTVQTNKVLPSLDMPDLTFAWGDIAVGTSGGVKSVTLTSLSSEPVVLTATFESGGQGVFSFPSAPPTTVPGRGTAIISVNFIPTAAIPYADALIVTPAAPNTNNTVHRIPLTGIGDIPLLSFAPSHLGFAAIGCPAQIDPPRCSDTETVTLTNTGIVNVTLSSVAIVADVTNPLPANLILSNNFNGTIITPGVNLPILVLWHPDSSQSATGDFSANMVIQSNAGDNPTITIPLAAQALTALPPVVCVNVLSVEAREYVEVSGTPTPEPVVQPQVVWEDMSTPPLATTIHVRPGWQIDLTSLPVRMVESSADGGTPEPTGTFAVDTVAEQMMPCTNDPQGLPLTQSWSLAMQPSGSRASIMPTSDDGVAAADGQITLDAVGTYVVNFTATDTLGLSTTSSFTLDAVPHDDLVAEVDWTDTVGNDDDLDVHLIVDSGPGVTGEGNLFCTQDCFFYNPAPAWFSGPEATNSANEIPLLLYDDQGNPGGQPSTESIDLNQAPQPSMAFPNNGSTYRVAVYMFNATEPITPTVTILHLGVPVGPPLTASQPLMNNGDVWYAAQVDFDPSVCASCTTVTCDCIPTVTPIAGAAAFTNVPFPTPPMTLGNWGSCQ